MVFNSVSIYDSMREISWRLRKINLQIIGLRTDVSRKGHASLLTAYSRRSAGACFFTRWLAGRLIEPAGSRVFVGKNTGGGLRVR